MLLQDIEKFPNALMYLERYVNDGSPSGFTEINRTSHSTDPFGLTPWFYLYLCQGKEENFLTYGEIPTPAEIKGVVDDDAWVLVHPDMKSHEFFQGLSFRMSLLDSMRVVPTSSCRTVQILNRESPDYVKLHYDSIIGRINRALPYKKAIAGPEISKLILESLQAKLLPEILAVLPEVGARVAFKKKVDDSSWGMVWRSYKPKGLRVNEVNKVIPYFSLFSFDRLRLYEPPLLVQIVERRGQGAKDLILNEIIIPIVRIYFELLLNLGLQFEFNAQNVLVGFDENWRVVSVILRDLMGVEKDISLRKELDQNTDFVSCPYKCISREDGDLYLIRHSFSYDFKLGEYIIEPLLDLATTHFSVPKKEMQETIRSVAQYYTSRLPSNFFPRDVWYVHKRELLHKYRHYFALKHPKYR